MKPLINFLTVPLFFLLSCSAQAQAPNSKEPDDLDRLRRNYIQRRADALRPVTAAYVTQLEALQKKLTQNNDLAGALLVSRELESIRQSSAQEGQGDLKKALIANTWSWTGKAGEKGVEMTFKDDGTVAHIGMHGTWQITALLEVTITVSDGAKVVLRFDASLNSYSQPGGKIRGRRWK